MTRGIHHLGVAVTDLDEAVATYKRLFGAQLEHRSRVEDQGVEAAAMHVGSGLAKRGPGMHHVAYEVDDVRTALASLEADGAQLIDQEPREGLFGLEVAFVHPDAVHGVLSEVVSVGGQ